MVRTINQGWLVARKVKTDIDDSRFWNQPFPFAKDRQAWPKVDKINIWLFKQRIDFNDGQAAAMKQSPELIPPKGVQPDDLNLVMGWPYQSD